MKGMRGSWRWGAVVAAAALCQGCLMGVRSPDEPGEFPCRKTGDCADDQYCSDKDHRCWPDGTDPVEDGCQDGTKNSLESDVDCGGLCPDCDTGATCNLPEDCASGHCTDGTCSPGVGQCCLDPARCPSTQCADTLTCGVGHGAYVCCAEGQRCCTDDSNCLDNKACDTDTYQCHASCADDDDSRCRQGYHCFSGDSRCYSGIGGSRCDDDSECNSLRCTAADHPSAPHVCADKLSNGTSCQKASDCASDACSNNVCCGVGQVCCTADEQCPDHGVCNLTAAVCYGNCANNDALCRDGYHCYGGDNTCHTSEGGGSCDDHTECLSGLCRPLDNTCTPHDCRPVIVFSSYRDGDWDIYAMDPTARTTIPLTENTEYDTRPVASPDGSKIAFVATRVNHRGIFVMHADGSGEVAVTAGMLEEYDITWSPDSSQLAVQDTRDGSFDIFVVDADGSNAVNLTRNDAYDSDPAWSPDGSAIAFSRGADIYAIDPQGGVPRNLTNSTDSEYGHRWSPDGKSIAFVRYLSQPEINTEIFVMSADGTTQTNLTNNAARDSLCDWSPDGTKIAFLSDRDGTSEIFVMDPEGGSVTKLTHDASPGCATWSPDGSHVTYLRADEDGDYEIYLMSADGGTPIKLTDNDTYDGEASWACLTGTGPFENR